MHEHNPTVGPLKKITLQYVFGATPEPPDWLNPPASFEFIFGLGVDGLTPFEYALEGKCIGDKVQYRLARKSMDETFGHLVSNIDKWPAHTDDVYLTIEVVDIQEAEQRELVQALAATTSCGCGCGCGCGSH